MNSNQKRPWIKIASIPILAIVLYSVWPKGEKVESPALNLTETRTSSDRTQKRREFQVATPAWPRFTSQDIVDLDPFDKGMIFPELVSKAPEVVPKDSMHQKLISTDAGIPKSMASTLKIQAIFQSPRGVAALVDSKLVHIGDRLSDGNEVIGITSEQLIVTVPGRD